VVCEEAPHQAVFRRNPFGPTPTFCRGRLWQSCLARAVSAYYETLNIIPSKRRLPRRVGGFALRRKRVDTLLAIQFVLVVVLSKGQASQEKVSLPPVDRSSDPTHLVESVQTGPCLAGRRARNDVTILFCASNAARNKKASWFARSVPTHFLRSAREETRRGNLVFVR
jgi:hypothetical protein